MLAAKADIREELDRQPALLRIEQGIFGRCEECGEEIPEARLEAVPYARHCIDCARKIEAEAGYGAATR